MQEPMLLGFEGGLMLQGWLRQRANAFAGSKAMGKEGKRRSLFDVPW